MFRPRRIALCAAMALLATPTGLQAAVDEGERDAWPAGPEGPRPVSAAVELFERKLDLAFRTGDFVGLAVAVVADGQPVFLLGRGSRSVEGAAPVTPRTRFRIASLSKGIAAALAVQLALEGAIDLDMPVARHAPGFRLARPGAVAQATLETVLSHRIGLPPYAYDNLLEAGVPVPRILERLGEVRLLCPVGACYTYQNVAFSLVEPAVEAATGHPFSDAVAARLFGPLYMMEASYGAEALVADENWARPHVRREGRWVEAMVEPAYYRVPAAGGVNASVADMARWLAAQMGAAPAVLSPAALDLLHRPRVETLAELRRIRKLRARVNAAWYALGWRVYDYAGRRVVMHNGGLDGYRAQIAFLPDESLGLVALWNSMGDRGWGLMPTLFDAYLGLDDPDWLRLACTGARDDAAYCTSTAAAEGAHGPAR